MQNAAIEIFYLFFQGILCFQVVLFFVMYVLTRRKDILNYSLFLFFAAAYFFMNAPYTFFGIPEDDFWNSLLYKYFNIPLIIIENLFYLLFLKTFFEGISNDKKVEKQIQFALWLIPFTFAIFILLTTKEWDTQSIFYTVKMISVIPAIGVTYLILKKNLPFAKLVANGLLCTIIGTSLTVFMIILGNNGIHELFTDGYPLFFIRLGILGDMIFYFVAILKKWHYQEKQLVQEKLNFHLAEEQFRNKISSELHDDLGSSLSGISMHSYLAHTSLLNGQYEKAQQSTEFIQKSADELITNMGDLIWTINPENDEFEKIVLRMRNFAYDLLGAKNIDFEFVADEHVTKLKLPMETRKNLYLIFKEATNNLAKYSGAAKAFFLLKEESNILIMQIRDNGKGFNILQSGSGNGLKNIQKRAAEINADCIINPVPGNGTSIEIKFNHLH